MNKEFTDGALKELLGSPTDITKLSLSSKSTLLEEAAFNLYREAASIATVASGIHVSADPNCGFFPRNQAIEVGLIVRVTKFMVSVLALQCDRVRNHGEVIMALNRCILESAINLKFFCQKATDQDFEEFVKSSLKPERDTYNHIKENIAKRGKELPIEKRMLKSIEKTFEVSGIKSVSDLNKIKQRKSYKNILVDLDKDSIYSMLQGIPSHAIHGDWVDLFLNQLEENVHGFVPSPEGRRADVRFLCPINEVVLAGIKAYIEKRFRGDQAGVIMLLRKIDDLLERNFKLDQLHEQKLQRTNV